MAIAPSQTYTATPETLMLNPLSRSSLFLATAVLTLGSGLFLPALSQREPQTGEFQTNERDPVFGNNGLNPLDLIRRAQQTNNTYDADLQNENLTEAARNLRRLQREAIEKQQQQQNQAPAPETPETVQPE